MNFSPFSARRALAVAALAGSGAAFLSAPAQAQDAPAQNQQSEIDVLRGQIAELQKRLDAIDAAQKATDKTIKEAKPVVNAKSPIVVSGLLQVHALDFFNQGGNSANRAADTFRLRRGELRLTAPRITDKVSATVMFDPAKDATSGRARNNILQEIVVSYQLNKTATNSNSIDVGQFKIPVGYESLVSSSALPFVERPLIFTARDPFDGGYGDVRDTGLQLNSKLNDFDLKVGVFNGIGDRQNALALSDEKAILGRVAYNGVKNLSLGISGGVGNTGTNGSANGATVTRRAHRNLLNLFAAYNKDKIYAAGEFLRGDAVPITFGTNNSTNAPIIVNGRDIQGYYAAAGYMFTPKLQGVVRYDNLNTNRSQSDMTLRDYTLGLNYFVKGNEAKVQFNVVDHEGDTNAIGFRGGLELRTAFQAAF